MTETLCTGIPVSLTEYGNMPWQRAPIMSECRTLTVLFRALCYILRNRCVHLPKKRTTQRETCHALLCKYSQSESETKSKQQLSHQQVTRGSAEISHRKKKTQGKSAHHAHKCNYLTCPVFGAALRTTTEAAASGSGGGHS